MEEEKKQSWFAVKKQKVAAWFVDHPELTLTVLGGLFTVIGAGINCYTVKNEYKDSVYMTDGDDVYKIPAKSMNSKKLKTVK